MATEPVGHGGQAHHVKLTEVDPRDETAFARWFDVLDGWQREQRPGEPGWLLEEQRAFALAGDGADPDGRVVLLQAEQDGVVHGIARAELPRRDNLHLLHGLVVVGEPHRRQGTGRLLLAELERTAVQAGRSAVIVEADEPPGAEGRSAARHLAELLGYVAEQEEVRRDIDLPLGAQVVEDLGRVAREHAADYVVRSWVGAAPDELAEELAGLFRVMSRDVPTAGLAYAEEDWDVARLRRDEAEAVQMGRRVVGAGAVHLPTGRLVAFTRTAVPGALPARAYQWDTLVVGEHRGHRLGTLVKLACLQRLAEQSPATQWISTWNAAENTPMIRVNDALGARTNGRLVAFQKRL